MLHEVSIAMTFPTITEALALFDKFDIKWPDSSRRADDIAPAIRSEFDGTKTVTAIVRFDDINVRNTLYITAAGAKASVVPGSTGFISKHECGHRIGVACTGYVRDEWGTTDV